MTVCFWSVEEGAHKDVWSATYGSRQTDLEGSGFTTSALAILVRTVSSIRSISESCCKSKFDSTQEKDKYIVFTVPVKDTEKI